MGVDAVGHEEQAKTLGDGIRAGHWQTSLASGTRLAGRDGARLLAPQTGTDSSHGRAIAAPAPLKIVRREIRSRRAALRLFMSVGLSVRQAFQPNRSNAKSCGTSVRLESLTYGCRRLFKLRAGDNCIHHATKR